MTTAAEAPPGPYLRLAEAADFARVSDSTIRRLVRAGRLRAYHVGARVLIKRSDLQALIERRSAGGGK